MQRSLKLVNFPFIEKYTWMCDAKAKETGVKMTQSSQKHNESTYIVKPDKYYMNVSIILEYGQIKEAP